MEIVAVHPGAAHRSELSDTNVAAVEVVVAAASVSAAVAVPDACAGREKMHCSFAASAGKKFAPEIWTASVDPTDSARGETAETRAGCEELWRMRWRPPTDHVAPSWRTCTIAEYSDSRGTAQRT